MKPSDVSLQLNIYCKMKKSTGSGRRGGARRTKPESKSFRPKHKLSQNSTNNSESDKPSNAEESKGYPKSKSGGKYGAKGKTILQTRTGSYRANLRRNKVEKRQPLPDSNAPMRLNRYVSQAGICSR